MTNPPAMLAELVSSSRGRAVVVVRGEVDIYTAEAMWRVLERVIADHDRVIVEMSAVDFLDSTGMAVPIRSLKRLRERQGHLVLQSPRQRVRQALDVAGLTKVFEIVD